MQLKTVNKIIREKMESWLKSINDERLRERVPPKSFSEWRSYSKPVTGEKVNDYDVYIMDIDVLKDLSEYYCKPKSIGLYDGRNREEYIQDHCNDRGLDRDMFNQDISLSAVTIRVLADDQIKIAVAGAGLRFDEPESEETYEVVFLSPNAISLSGDVQIVTRFSGSPEEIHKNYDFVHATNFFTWDEGLVTNKEALESLLTKQLKYQGSLYPLTSIIRVKKFTGRGYNINAGEMLKMIFQVSQLDLTDINVLHDQLIGVDVAYFSTLIKILSDSKPEQVASYKYIAAMIDKVFGE